MSAAFKRIKAALTPTQSSTNLSRLSQDGAHTASLSELFPKTDPSVDGEDCLHDCATCTIHYPSKFSIDEDDKLYGFVKGWSTHLLVATGKTDWVRDVADEEGSVMEAVGKGKVHPSNGRLMLSASNIPLPYCPVGSNASTAGLPTTVLLLPACLFVENVTPVSVPEFITTFVDRAPTNTSLLASPSRSSAEMGRDTNTVTPDVSSSRPSTPSEPFVVNSTSNPTSGPDGTTTSGVSCRAGTPEMDSRRGLQRSLRSLITPAGITARACPHKYLILLCSQKTRDARCGQSAPLLLREFSRHLRPLGLYRDLNDERPGGVGIYFISHVGGHKYSANVMIYRRVDDAGNETEEASQCIWLARVRPEDCENIVRYTVLQGKVVKPERQLRGGFDRARGLVSW